MTIYCSKCGKQHPDDAKFCMGCGQPLKAGVQSLQTRPAHWEYKDITIRFPREGFTDIYELKSRLYNEVVQRADSIILARLQQEGREGWQAEGPTDFRTLDQLKLVQKRKRIVLALTAGSERVTYEQVTIRLKRLVS
jgi:zinc-ribbon domain